MRRQFLDLIRRFHSDERGVFLVIFGIMVVVLVAMAGAVVDYVSIEQARTRAQVALDSAALALQERIYLDTPEQIRVKAEGLVQERVGDGVLDVVVEEALVNITDGSLQLGASFNISTMFVSLVGIPSIEAAIVSEATRKKLNLEVVMVLDNSRSMENQNRMPNLIEATRCAVNILFNSDCASTSATATNANTWIGIVPFTMLVNVGTGNATATWLDRTGNNGTTITNDNFDSDDNDTTAFSGLIDRIALMNQLTGVDWGGCVEARISPYDTDDAVPVAGTNTMFTPLFAPDEPSGFTNSYISDLPASCNPAPRYVWTQTKYSCNQQGTTQNSYNGATCSGGAAPLDVYETVSPTGVVTTVTATRPSSIYNNPDPGANAYTDAYAYVSGSGSAIVNRRVRTWTYLYSNRELQERICKYTGATPTGVSQSGAHGPNSDCPTNAITPLTSNKATVTAAVNALAPQGGTNIHAGTEWGFRVLSPTVPFVDGKAYDAATSKVMIVMTDGENTAYQTGNMNNTTYYSHYGFPWNARMGTASSTDAQLETEMNARLLATCQNAKGAGIIVYTIGLSVSQTNNPATNTQMLKDCSSGTGYWFFPAVASELTSVFSQIALQLGDLRLAQ